MVCLREKVGHQIRQSKSLMISMIGKHSRDTYSSCSKVPIFLIFFHLISYTFTVVISMLPNGLVCSPSARNILFKKALTRLSVISRTRRKVHSLPHTGCVWCGSSRSRTGSILASFSFSIIHGKNSRLLTMKISPRIRLDCQLHSQEMPQASARSGSLYPQGHPCTGMPRSWQLQRELDCRLLVCHASVQQHEEVFHRSGGLRQNLQYHHPESRPSLPCADSGANSGIGCSLEGRTICREGGQRNQREARTA